MTVLQKMYLCDQEKQDGLFCKDSGQEHLQSPVF